VTPKGQRAFRDAERRHGARVTKLFAALSSIELSALTRLLDKLKDDLRERDPDGLRPLRAPSGRAHADRGAAGPRRRVRPKP
jgi:hypothetical protein